MYDGEDEEEQSSGQQWKHTLRHTLTHSHKHTHTEIYTDLDFEKRHCWFWGFSASLVGVRLNNLFLLLLWNVLASSYPYLSYTHILTSLSSFSVLCRFPYFLTYFLRDTSCGQEVAQLRLSRDGSAREITDFQETLEWKEKKIAVGHHCKG